VSSGIKYVIVGAGFYGAVLAERIADHLGEKVLLLESRDHLGGNCHSQDDPDTGIHYHTYGTHIFHTPERRVWDYLSRFTEFNGYYHQVLTIHQDQVYQMPINLETINSFFGLNLKPFQVEAFLVDQRQVMQSGEIENFEDKAISLIGRPLYEAFIRGYTRKQWGRDPRDLPASILKRLPVRSNYNESYYFSRWQGIPEDGYTAIFEKLLNNALIEIKLGCDFFENQELVPKGALLIYSGPIDRYFNFRRGRLDWRTLEFQFERPSVEDFQGTSVMNYADEGVPYTRIHEPKHLHPERDYPHDRTLIIKEFSRPDQGNDPFYPISDSAGKALYGSYRLDADRLANVLIGGRLGDYKYYDMHHVIGQALTAFDDIVIPWSKANE